MFPGRDLPNGNGEKTAKKLRRKIPRTWKFRGSATCTSTTFFTYVRPGQSWNRIMGSLLLSSGPRFAIQKTRCRHFFILLFSPF